ncbi:N-acetyltransferase [Streptomyces reniochalinae]|uniref:N-acetyltransferase n=2 Tax=Streptomyces reniochalinae TaxID=2250578 RepID=A0A367F6U6_9ACTN|nr:N-acetyltransferase [Streptomyces reniochalinae]
MRSPERVRFVELSGGTMSALLKGGLTEAGRVAGVPLTEYFVTDEARWLWRYRLSQMAADPGHARWMLRQAVVDDSGPVAGHAGFHGPPDEVGMVEIGYCIAPDFRRQGYARSALIELLRRASAETAVTTVRATMSPDNVASLATISGLGFVEVGEQWDEENGREIVFEVPVRRVPSAGFRPLEGNLAERGGDGLLPRLGAPRHPAPTGHRNPPGAGTRRALAPAQAAPAPPGHWHSPAPVPTGHTSLPKEPPAGPFHHAGASTPVPHRAVAARCGRERRLTCRR